MEATLRLADGDFVVGLSVSGVAEAVYEKSGCDG